MLQVTLPDELPRAHHEPPLVSCTFTSRAAVGAIARVTLSRFVDVSASSLEPLLTEVSQKLNRAFGPTAAVEVTPIENWLELEVGVASELAIGPILGIDAAAAQAFAQ